MDCRASFLESARRLGGRIKEIVKYSKVKWRKKTLLATATEGWVRFEWAHARFCQIIPINWELGGFDINYTAAGFSIDDAYNSIVKFFIETGREWLLIVEDDVILPADCFVRMGQYINTAKIPVVSGLYYSKGRPSEPLLFRGKGNGCFTKWKQGDLVWCDGLPMGCLLLHGSLIHWMWENSEPYRMDNGEQSRRVFQTPKLITFDEERRVTGRKEGTQDLFFFDNLMEKDVLRKTGWKAIAKRKYPFLCDTNIFCRHIDRNSGRQFP